MPKEINLQTPLASSAVLFRKRRIKYRTCFQYVLTEISQGLNSLRAGLNSLSYYYF